MATDRIAVAQRGRVLADAVGDTVGPRARTATGARKPRKSPKAAGVLSGPFLSPGSLSRAERLRLIEGIEAVIDGVYTHLPLKRARYGTDPVQRLRILRSQVDELTDDAFHLELADLVTRLRDAHTRYAGPMELASKVAALPFLVEMIGTTSAPTYVVTKVGHGLASTFRPGVVLEYWNGMPIDRAVQRYSESEVGGRPDSQRAWATQSLTLRSLQYSPPPDEHWVIVGYRSTTTTGAPTGPAREVKIPWQVVDPSQIVDVLSGGPTGRVPVRLRRARAIDPAAAAIRQAKMLLFAPAALTGGQAAAPKRAESTRNRPPAATVIDTTLTRTLKAMSIDAPGGAYGYLRIYGFDTLPEPFINELIRLIPLLPERGLILDVRGNPGGYIWAAELALQLFTPKPIQPTRFSLLATPFTRDMAELPSLRDDLGPWKASLDAAVRNGELYSQPIPISDVAACNAIGQQYGGPVVLVGDSTTYSAGDLFSAGFVDNGIGPFVCVGEATGAGGANVWDYADLRSALVRIADPASGVARRHRVVAVISPGDALGPERRPSHRGHRHSRGLVQLDARRSARRQPRSDRALHLAAEGRSADRDIDQCRHCIAQRCRDDQWPDPGRRLVRRSPWNIDEGQRHGHNHDPVSGRHEDHRHHGMERQRGRATPSPQHRLSSGCV